MKIGEGDCLMRVLKLEDGFQYYGHLGMATPERCKFSGKQQTTLFGSSSIIARNHCLWLKLYFKNEYGL